MNDGIYFADPELPFHVWVRQPSGEDGFRWVLREADVAREIQGSGVTDPKKSDARVPRPED